MEDETRENVESRPQSAPLSSDLASINTETASTESNETGGSQPQHVARSVPVYIFIMKHETIMNIKKI